MKEVFFILVKNEIVNKEYVKLKSVDHGLDRMGWNHSRSNNKFIINENQVAKPRAREFNFISNLYAGRFHYIASNAPYL